MLKSIFRTATFKQSQITFIGTVISSGLGALFYFPLARILGPSDFGLLSVSIVTLTLIADIADFGTNTGLVRFVSANFNTDKSKALRFLKLGLELKLLLWFVVLIVGYFVSPIISQSIFNKPELTSPLRLVMLGVGGALLMTFATSSLQASQKYLTWSTINITTNLLRVIMVAILFSFNQLNLYSGLLSYILLPFFGFSLALLFLPFREIIFAKNEFSLARQFMQYNFWVAIFTILAAFSSRLDTFISVRLLSVKEVGLYSAANQLVVGIPQIVSALGVVAAPKFASFTNNKDMLNYLKKFQLLVTGLCLAGILTIPLLIYFFPFLFGAQYIEGAIPFAILFFAMLVFLFSVPIHNSVIYYFGRPDVFIAVALGHLVIIGGLGYILISNFGITGAALTVLTGMIFNFLYPLGWLLYKLKTK